MRAVAFVSLKGGTGKTTLAFGIALHWAEKGFKVLAVDLDPQSNLTLALSSGRVEEEARVRLLLNGGEGAPKEVDIEGLKIWLLGADESLWERDLKGLSKTKLREIALPGEFDLAVIDTPTGLRALTTLAVVLSDAIVVPLDPSPFAVAGLARLVTSLERIRRDFGKGARLLGVVLNLAERTRLCWDTEGSLKDLLEERFLGSLRRTVRIKEAISSQKPLHRLNVPAGEEFRGISERILERMVG